MPRKPLDRMAVTTQLLGILRVEGPQAGGRLPERLGVSHATVSRLIANLTDEIVTVGRGKATHYAARRSAGDLPSTIPIREVLPEGSTRELGTLHVVSPTGFYSEGQSGSLPTRRYRDLPWFLDDLRPAGFLGRLVPRRHPELRLPDDIRNWSAETVLRYIVRNAWDSPGSLIIGDDAFRLFLAHGRDERGLIDAADRSVLYPRMALNVLTYGVPGSSAAGEQPKFLATLAQGAKSVLVKFSPPVDTALGLRIADLLVCEHLALSTIQSHGYPASQSAILEAGDRVFLEVERFDRTGIGGRVGLFSLAGLDAEFVGGMGQWSSSVEVLVRQRVIDKGVLPTVRWLELFSRLVANTDMHFGNLSFLARGTDVIGLAPAYDVSPMLYAPQGGQLVERSFDPPLPAPEDAPYWEAARQAATEFWIAAADDRRISVPFRAIASKNAASLEHMRGVGEKLPPRLP